MVDEATILSMHRDNQAATTRLSEEVSEVREEQGRVAEQLTSQQNRTNDILERHSFILEGDGNGHPGLVRKVDSLVETRDQAVELAKALWHGTKQFMKWAIPIVAMWIASWLSLPGLRNYVHQFTKNGVPALQSKPDKSSVTAGDTTIHAGP